MNPEQDDNNTNALIDRLDGSGTNEEWTAATELRVKFGGALPIHLLQHYKTTNKWAARSSLLYHSTRYAKESDAAIQLALLAVKDKSKAVRYRACLLLAYSQRKDLLPLLLQMVDDVPSETKGDLMAAVDAIQSENHHYFVDRDHSGLTKLNIK